MYDVIVVGARCAGSPGAEVVEGFTVSDRVFSEGRVVGIRGSERDRPEMEFRASLVVGADGHRSTVARKTNAEPYKVRPAAGVNYYAYYSGLDAGPHHKVSDKETWLGVWPTHQAWTNKMFGLFAGGVEHG